MEVTDQTTEEELKKKIREEEQIQAKLYYVVDEEAQDARKEALNEAVTQVASQEKYHRQKTEEEIKITEAAVAEYMEKIENETERSKIVRPKTDYSLPGEDGVYKTAGELKGDTPENIEEQVREIIKLKPAVEAVTFKTAKEVTRKDVKRVVGENEVVIFDRSLQKPA